MSEEMLSGEERANILKNVFPPAPVNEDINTPKRNDAIPEGKADLSQPTFGELLEQCAEIRAGHIEEDKKDEEYVDNTREQAIKLSRMDILEGWKL
jgi:hypothetical protein